MGSRRIQGQIFSDLSPLTEGQRGGVFMLFERLEDTSYFLSFLPPDHTYYFLSSSLLIKSICYIKKKS